MPKEKNKDKWYNNVFIWAMAILIVLIFITIDINTNKPKPKLDIKINDAILTLPATSPAIASTTTAPATIDINDYCEKSCITRTHYFSNGTRKLICVPLKDIGACEEVDD